MSTVLRELLTTQKNEINGLIVQHLRQQRSVTPKPQATVVSSPPNPTSTIDSRQQNALKLARSGQLNQAFEYVLSASDLNLVLYLCENLRPADLFSIQPCPLQIPVILSLIQQLAADLTTHQDLKYQ
jgi:enhancer of mRNA-decapping protein 4